MHGYWWIEPRAYVRDAPLPRWMNRDVCVAEPGRLRYEDNYRGADRRLIELRCRPQFDVAHRERRPVAMRGLSPSFRSDPGAIFLVSEEFAAALEAADPPCVVYEVCDVLYNGTTPCAGYVIADAAVIYDAFAVLDRAASRISMRFGFRPTDGVREANIRIDGSVRFRNEVDRDFFRVGLGRYETRLAVSDRLAEVIFRGRFPGVQLMDAMGTREPPKLYRRYGEAGWDDIYPAEAQGDQ